MAFLSKDRQKVQIFIILKRQKPQKEQISLICSFFIKQMFDNYEF